MTLETPTMAPDYNAAVQLSEKQKKHLRRLAHPLRPLVMLGNAGLTDGVINELERALDDHELVKVSARVGARSARDSAFDELARRTRAQLVQRVGHIGVFYRQGRKAGTLAKILIPDE
jgi:RNA-binding protein